MISGNIFKKGR